MLVLPLNVVGPGPAANALCYVAFTDLGVATEFGLVSLPLRLDMYIRTDRAISILVFVGFLGRMVRVRSSRVGVTIAILTRPRLRDSTIMQSREMVRRDALSQGRGAVQWPVVGLPLLQLLNHQLRTVSFFAKLQGILCIVISPIVTFLGRLHCSEAVLESALIHADRSHDRAGRRLRLLVQDALSSRGMVNADPALRAEPVRGLGELDSANMLLIIEVVREFAVRVERILIGIGLPVDLEVVAFPQILLHLLVAVVEILLSLPQVLFRRLQLLLILYFQVGLQILLEIRGGNLVILLLTQRSDVGVLVKYVLVGHQKVFNFGY